MKRLTLIVLLLCLVTLAASMEALPEPLTVEELNAFTEGLLDRAIGEELAVVRGEEGFMAEGIGYTLYLTSEDLSADSLLRGAAINMASLHTESFTGPRGIGVTSTLEELLAVYPNDNPQLQGSISAALLYMRGELPEPVSMGLITRDGQDVRLVEHSVLLPSGNGVLRLGLQYLLEHGSVISLRYYGGDEALTAEQAEQAVQAAIALQEESGYFRYDTVAPSQLQREDLSVQGLDFLDLNPEAAAAAFGEVLHEERVKDSTGEEIRTLQYEGVEIAFVYKADGSFLKADRITVSREGIEGPRGLRVGTDLDSALSRFEHQGELNEDMSVLYGEAAAQQPPYGRLDREAGGARLYYAIDQQGSGILLSCLFIGDSLVELSISY